MDEKLIELQWRGMQENLIFRGIDKVELPKGVYENVEETLKDFLRQEMNNLIESIKLESLTENSHIPQ